MQPKRPLALTVVCILMILGVISSLSGYSQRPHGAEPGYTLSYIFTWAITLASAYGMWRMQKWAVYLFAAFALYFMLAAFQSGYFQWVAILRQAIYIGIAYYCIFVFPTQNTEQRDSANGSGGSPSP